MKTRLVKGTDGKSHLELADGSCMVKIYTGKQTKQGTTYPIHYVTYFEGGERIRQGFSDLEEAKTNAGMILTRLINGETAAKNLRPVEMQEAATAMSEAEALGFNLLTVVREYRRAIEQLSGKATLNDAVQFYNANACKELPEKTVGEVFEELIAAKKADRLSEEYVRDLHLRTRKFSRTFTGQIAEITTAQIDAWLRGLQTGVKNRNNYANAITTLFRFAKRAGYLSADRTTAADSLVKAKYTGGVIEIYTTSELRTILDRVQVFRPDLLPFIAIGAFAGVRTAELARMTWASVNREQGFIEVSANEAKTAQRRHIPIQTNLAAWLEPYRHQDGPICPGGRFQLAARKLLEAPVELSSGDVLPGIGWKHNALRHSYGSYRLPVTKSAAELALEMGNSPSMVFRHYRQLVTPKQAEEYWSIMPSERRHAARTRAAK